MVEDQLKGDQEKGAAPHHPLSQQGLGSGGG